jgi:hypothetical protein
MPLEYVSLATDDYTSCTHLSSHSTLYNTCKIYALTLLVCRAAGRLSGDCLPTGEDCLLNFGDLLWWCRSTTSLG